VIDLSKLSGVIMKIKVVFKESLEPDEVDHFANECSITIKHKKYPLKESWLIEYEDLVEE